MKYVCKRCSSAAIEEVGTLSESFSLEDMIEPDDNGLPVPVDGYDHEGDIWWDSYKLDGFRCSACNAFEETLADLVQEDLE